MRKFDPRRVGERREDRKLQEKYGENAKLIKKVKEAHSGRNERRRPSRRPHK
jgi:hypothetical protein